MPTKPITFCLFFILRSTPIPSPSLTTPSPTRSQKSRVNLGSTFAHFLWQDEKHSGSKDEAGQIDDKAADEDNASQSTRGGWQRPKGGFGRVVCVNVREQYKYNITLYNLIIRKCRVFVTCVCMYCYCYYVLITFYYKVRFQKKKKLVKFVIN